MKRMTALAALAALGSLIGGSGGRAGDKKAPVEKERVVIAEASEVVRAAGIDFREALGLTFDSLRTLGSRIDQARAEAAREALPVVHQTGRAGRRF